MTKTKLLLAGLLTGAVAFGTACKTDTATKSPEPMTPATTEDAGTGGTGFDTPRSTPLPNDGIREREPDVHNTPLDEPGTGGSGLEPNGMMPPDSIGNEPMDEPMRTTPPIDSSMDDDNTMTEDTQPLPKQ
ncbi:hypothetical protein ACN28S_55045 [Cystobacter fuscus]